MRSKRQVSDTEVSSKRLRAEIGAKDTQQILTLGCSRATPPNVQLPFWADGNKQQQPMAAVQVADSLPASLHAPAPSFQSWQPATGAPSLRQHSGSASEHDEFEDTASSSCSQETEEDTDDSEAEDAGTQRHQQGPTQAAAQPAAAAESLIPPFSFGDRPCTVPDVSEFETWDLVDTLLALGDQC